TSPGYTAFRDQRRHERTVLKNPRTRGATEAIALFCYQARKYLGALATVMGGLDTLLFSAGVVEHAASIRRRICEGQEFLGVELDLPRNEAHAPVISRERTAVTVRVLRTDEDLAIARHTRELIEKSS